MNEKLLNNLIMYQENLEKLDEPLFNEFIIDLVGLYDFLVKENDPLFSKEETMPKLKENPKHIRTLKTINTINHLDINRDTKYKLLKYLFEKNVTGNDNQIYMFSMYILWAKNTKLLKKQQKELLTILKENKGRNFLQHGGLILQFLMTIDIIKEKTFIDNMKGFQFEVFHELNKNEKINFHEMKDEVFIHYLLNQFATYKLKNPMSLIKNEVSLKDAVMPLLEQDLTQDKKDILSTVLNVIRHKLDLDNENNQFLDKLVLNTKLNQKNPTNKVKNIKI